MKKIKFKTNRNRIFKFTALVTLISIALSIFTACNGNDDEIVIGIAQFAEHGSLDNCREGFIEGLAQEGFIQGENIKILYDNAQADGGAASQIATNFSSDQIDLVAAIATPMAQSIFNAVKDKNIPLIYTAVTNPVTAGLANEDGSPTGNATGTSDTLPVEEQLKMIRSILPDAKKIGILYSTSEVNSLSTIEEYKELAPKYNFEIVESGISVSSDIPLATDNLLEKVDCITNLTDNTVVSSLPIILYKAKEKNIPVFGSEVEQVKNGCLAAMGIDYYKLGIETGKMAAKVLKGEKKASEMDYQIFKEASFYGNTKVAEILGITLPEEYVNSAAEMFDKIEAN